MVLVGLILFIMLTLIALLHAMWAFGIVWPAETEQALVNMVIGAPGMTMMPTMWSTFVVAALIFATGLLALAVSRPSYQYAGGIAGLFVKLLVLGAGVIFFARGIAGYFFGKVAWEPVEPFATLNILYYSPLCIVIGVAFFSLLFPHRN